MMLGIVAALPRELAGLVRGLSPDSAFRRRGVHLYRGDGFVAACAGMGVIRVTLAVEAALQQQGVTELVSTGLAGGCDPGLAAGDVVRAGWVVDTLSGERFDAGQGPVLATSHSIAGVQEKARLHASYGAVAVDMEAAAVGRLARMRGLGFQAVKAVSDAYDFELHSLGRFASAHGQFRTGAFAFHTAMRPHRWRHAVRLGAGSQRALRALTAELQTMVGQGRG